MKYKNDTIYKLNEISKPIKILVIMKTWFHVVPVTLPPFPILIFMIVRLDCFKLYLKIDEFG